MKAQADMGMQATQSRWTWAIALMMAVLGALIVCLRQPGGPVEVPATPIVPRAAAVEAPPMAAPAPAPSAKQAPRAEAPAARLEDSIGTASSTIHFERV